MSGLATILEENQRLRELLAVRERDLQQRDETLREHQETLRKRDETLREHQETLQQRDETLRKRDETLREREAMVATLRQQTDKLERALAVIEARLRGPASERYIPESQGVLPFSGEAHPPPRTQLPKPDPASKKPSSRAGRATRKRKPRRRKLQNIGLPVRDIHCRADPAAACHRCGGPLRPAGKATSHQVNWVPGHFVVDKHIRDRCACPSCPTEGILTVPPPAALARSICGNGLLSRLLIDKFSDHLPLHRQARRMGREGFEVATSTLSGWVVAAAELLSPLAAAIQADTQKSSFLQGDDSGFPVQDGGNGKLRKGRIWAFTDQEQVWYAFSGTKKGEVPARLLAEYSGEVLLADGGSEFNQVVVALGLERAGCWSHLRRYFFESRLYHPEEAGLALDTIQDLFSVERGLKGKPPDEVRRARDEFSRPLVDGLYVWVKSMSTVTRPDSLLGKALTYARNQEAFMRLFLVHPSLPIHNNLSELMLRQPVVGRKNWLFARSEGGAKAACTIYTIVGSCMLQGIDPFAYLNDIFSWLPDHPINRVQELTPRAWRLARQLENQPHTAQGD